jgi:hypothetical protein
LFVLIANLLWAAASWRRDCRIVEFRIQSIEYRSGDRCILRGIAQCWQWLWHPGPLSVTPRLSASVEICMNNRRDLRIHGNAVAGEVQSLNVTCPSVTGLLQRIDPSQGVAPRTARKMVEWKL